MQDDFLSRKPFLDLLKSIIANQCDNPSGYSFAIDGEWGCGKTWILDNLEKQLTEEKDNKYLIFHYNAWENDFYDEPLVALLSVMIESLNKQKTKVKEKSSIKKVVASSITALTKVVGTVIEKKWNINTNDIIDSVKDSGKAIADVKLTKSDFNSMLPLENALIQIKSVIKKLSKEKKIILIVDELDRCLPEYAIKVLERFHHICNEMPVIQIIAYSGNALAHSIAQIFGKNSSDRISNKAFAEHYLEKFVKLTLPLNYGTANDDLHCMYEGLEKKYRPCFNDSEYFLKQFYKDVLERLPIRNKKQILDAVKMVHELVLASEDFKEFTSTYELLCCEILISTDRILFHAQSPLNIEFRERENSLHLSFKSDTERRYSDIMDLEDFIQIFESIEVVAQKQQEPVLRREWYNVFAGNSMAIIFLTFADGKDFLAESNYSHLLGRPSTEIVRQNKIFIEKFYSLLYRFFYTEQNGKKES